MPDNSDPTLNEWVTALYTELHRIASRQLRNGRPDHTLQPTALLNEAYLKLADGQSRFNDRIHFLVLASRVMRQVLVDYARSRATQKRSHQNVEDWSGDMAKASLQIAADNRTPLRILQLNSALEALSREDEPLARLIEMHYFGGMTAKEIGEALGHSVHVVRHDLRFAQAWLRRTLSLGETPSKS